MSALRFDLKGKRVYIAGHKGMAGSALVRRLASEGCEIVTADRRTLDLTDQAATEFAAIVRDVAGYGGEIDYDRTWPDGPPQKLLDSSKLTALGWSCKISLRNGLAAAYADFLANGGRAAA